MHNLPNKFLARYEPAFGIPAIKPAAGETFDVNNDLTMGADGCTVYHRDGHKSYGGAADALLEYDKRHMSRKAFADFYGTEDDGRAEEMMLLGACG